MQEVQADIHFLFQHFFCLPFPYIYFCLPSSWWPKKVPFLFPPFSLVYVFIGVGLDLLLVVSHTLSPNSDICLKNIFPDSIISFILAEIIEKHHRPQFFLILNFFLMIAYPF